MNIMIRFPSRVLLTWLLVFGSLSGFTQENSASSNLHWQFDRDFYVLGETIRFALFLTSEPNASQQMISLELVEPEGQIVETQLIRVTKGRGIGNLTLDRSLKPGIYRIFAYEEVPAGIDKSDKFINNHITIPVYSLDQSKAKVSPDQHAVVDDDYSTENAGKGITFEEKSKYLNIRASLDKVTFSKRESVKISIFTSNRDGEPVQSNLAIRVLNKNFELPGVISNGVMRQDTALPTSKGQRIADIIAHIKNLKKTSLKALSRVSVFFIEDQIIEEFYIDELDDLIHVRDDLYEDNHMFIYGFNWKGDRLGEVFIQGLEEKPSDSYPVLNDELLHFKQVVDYIEFKKKSNIIDFVYEIPKAVYSSENSSVKGWRKPDYSVNLTDFNRLPTVKEVIRGIVPKTHVKKENKKNRIYISPKTSGFKYDNTPLILINDLPTFDDSLVLALNVKDLEKIEVRCAIRTQGEFGTFGNKGILSVFLREGVENPLKKSMQRLPKIQAISIPQQYAFNRAGDNEGKIPDFRQLLYWNANVTTDDEGKVTVEFRNADILSGYEIRVEGISTNGSLGSTQLQYEVTKKL